MTTPVLIAVRGAREGAIAAAIGTDRRFMVARRCADLAEALAAAEAGLGALVLVSEQPQLDRGAVDQFHEAGVAMVGVPGSADAARHLTAIGIADLIPEGADARAATGIVAKVASRAVPKPRPAGEIPPVAPPPAEGSIVAVWGPAGAPGRTTVAVNLAAELAARTSVVLADADTYGGAVAQALGMLDEAPGLAALARAGLNGTLDAATVVRHAPFVSDNLRVATGLTRPDRWTELSGSALAPVWDALRATAQVTVVDCGFSVEQDEVLQYDTRAPQRNGATLSALAAADVLVVVGTAEPLGMQRLINGLAALERLAPPITAARLVAVNRVRASVAGLRPNEAVADVLRRYTDVEHVWMIPHDPRACDAAALAGQTLRERVPRSAARKAISQIATAVLAASSAYGPTSRFAASAPVPAPAV